MHPTIFLIQKEFATRAESCQRSVDLKFEECARSRVGVEKGAKTGGTNPPAGEQDRPEKVPVLLSAGIFQENFLSRYLREDNEHLVLSDSEPEESKLVNQSIEGEQTLILLRKLDSYPIVFRPR